MQNPNSIMNGFQSFMQNPMRYMMQRNFNIPQEYANNPDKIIQYLMDTGRVNQSQYNQAKQMASQMQGGQMFGHFRKN